jgi:hypothetical protein
MTLSCNLRNAAGHAAALAWPCGVLDLLDRLAGGVVAARAVAVRGQDARGRQGRQVWNR